MATATLADGTLADGTLGEIFSRIIVTREHPPTNLSVVIKAEDGTPLANWSEGASKLQNVLGSLTKDGEMPGGHKESGCSLPRDPKQSYPDSALFSRYEVKGAGGERVFSGTIRQKPEDADRGMVEVKAVGDKQLLEDDEAIVGPGFINSGLSNWTDPSTQRRLNIIAVAWYLAASASVASEGAGEALASLFFDFTSVNKEAGKTVGAEMWFDGGGVDLGALLYDFIGDGTATWSTSAGLSTDDILSSDEYNSPNGTTALQQSKYAAGPGMKHAFLSDFYTGAYVGQMTNKHYFESVKVLGRHELELQGTWPLVGFLAKQMIPVIAQMGGLTTNPELLDDDGFIIPQAWFAAPSTLMSKLVEVCKYGLLDWFVFNDRVLQYRFPGTYGRRWRLAPGSGAPKNAGDDGNRVWESITATWQDVDGTTKSVGPPGSGAMFTDPRLKITDERNPAVAAGTPRKKLLALNGVSELEPAIRTAQRFLEEAQNLAQSGEATISGHCQDEYGIWWPAAYVQPGDWAADPGSSNYRKITSCSYAHDSKTASITLGAPPEQESALEERFNARLIELGLG